MKLLYQCACCDCCCVYTLCCLVICPSCDFVVCVCACCLSPSWRSTTDSTFCEGSLKESWNKGEFLQQILMYNEPVLYLRPGHGVLLLSRSSEPCSMTPTALLYDLYIRLVKVPQPCPTTPGAPLYNFWQSFNKELCNPPYPLMKTVHQQSSLFLPYPWAQRVLQ